MVVQAKFNCTETRVFVAGPGKVQHTALFIPVYSDTGENRRFWEATPSGRIEIACTKDQHFDVGKDYYIEFKPAE